MVLYIKTLILSTILICAKNGFFDNFEGIFVHINQKECQKLIEVTNIWVLFSLSLDKFENL